MDQQPTTLSGPSLGSIDQPVKDEVAQHAGLLRKAALDSVIHELRTPLTAIKTSTTACSQFQD
jgi:K+-sensing histidine kinase KdpD